MARSKIQTTTGTAKPEDLGRTLIHEHVLVGFPGWELDAKAPKFKRAEGMARAVDQMHELQAHGLKTFVDPCPMDLGRDAEFLAELSQKTGLRVICTIGAYFEAEGNTYTFRHLPVEEITDIYIKEIEEGIGETGIKADAIKIATGAPTVSDYERKLVTAGARAAKATGVSVISHTQDGCCGHDQIDIVTGEGWRRASCSSGTPMASMIRTTMARWPSAARLLVSTASGSRSFSRTKCASTMC
ncbi:MAG: phosphotriesterase [Gammaproteobacteria bacterium]|nr:phosphotriesterase [Gammaproteobacteria bacterium]